MTVRYSPGFRMDNSIEAQELLSGRVSRADIQPGTVIEAIASDVTFDRLVVSLGRLTLSDAQMTKAEIDRALATLYQPVTQKPTIAGRFEAATTEDDSSLYTRALIIVPPYKPPISDDNGYVREATVSAWAVKKAAGKTNASRPLLGVSCTIYQPVRHSRDPYLLKILGKVEEIPGNSELLGRLQSNRKVLKQPV